MDDMLAAMRPEAMDERIALAMLDAEPAAESDEKKIDFENDPHAGHKLLSRFGFNGSPR